MNTFDTMNRSTLPIGLQRLIQLYEHASKGKLSHKFDFRRFHTEQSCGTNGCLAGELPALFPNEWRYLHDATIAGGTKVFSIVRRVDSSLRGTPVCEMSAFFSLDRSDIQALFYPTGVGDTARSILGLCPLHGESPIEDVLANLEVFIDRKIKELNK